MKREPQPFIEASGCDSAVEMETWDAFGSRPDGKPPHQSRAIPAALHSAVRHQVLNEQVFPARQRVRAADAGQGDEPAVGEGADQFIALRLLTAHLLEKRAGVKAFPQLKHQ